MSQNGLHRRGPVGLLPPFVEDLLLPFASIGRPISCSAVIFVFDSGSNSSGAAKDGRAPGVVLHCSMQFVSNASLLGIFYEEVLCEKIVSSLISDVHALVYHARS